MLPTPRGFPGGEPPLWGAPPPLGVAYLGPLFSPVRCASSAAPPQLRGPLSASRSPPGYLQSVVSQLAPGLQLSPWAFATSGLFSLFLSPLAAEPLGSSVQLGPRAVQASGLLFQGARSGILVLVEETKGCTAR